MIRVSLSESDRESEAKGSPRESGAERGRTRTRVFGATRGRSSGRPWDAYADRPKKPRSKWARRRTTIGTISIQEDYSEDCLSRDDAEKYSIGKVAQVELHPQVLRICEVVDGGAGKKGTPFTGNLTQKCHPCMDLKVQS